MLRVWAAGGRAGEMEAESTARPGEAKVVPTGPSTLPRSPESEAVRSRGAGSSSGETLSLPHSP